MKSIYFIFVLYFNCVFSLAQSYTIEIEKLPYDTLDNYKSLANERAVNMQFPYRFETDFEFGFEFPYFDTTLTTLKLLSSSIGDIEGSEEYVMYLFSSEYELYPEFFVEDPLDSDFRYKYDTINNTKVFIFEFRRVLFNHNPDDIKFAKTDISFQHWFWENGNIEVRFGDIYFRSDIYSPGEGVRSLDNEKYFPFGLQISKFDLTETINISGNLNDNPSIQVTDNWDQDFPGITYIPEKNTVCRFKKLTSKTKDQSTPISMASIVHDQINIAEDFIFENYIIFDIMGNQLLSGKSNIVDTQGLNSGSYILVLNHKHGTKTHRFIKM